MSTDSSVEALVELGFTHLEAEIYAFLVQESPATGYRVAQALGKPVANTYKAIETLQNKGAILLDESSTRHYRAVPPAEVLSRMERTFVERKVRATQELSRLRSAPQDDRVYRLTTRDQVLERCRGMIQRSRSVLLIDLFPLLLAELRSDLERAAERGVVVAVKTYLPAEVAGARVLLNPRGEDLMRRYPGQWMIVNADGSELLIASLTADAGAVVQSVWTSSVYLAWIVHTSIAAEFLLTETLMQLERGVSGDDLRAAFGRIMHREAPEPGPGVPTDLKEGVALLARCYSPSVPGYQMMLEQLEGLVPNPVLNGQPTEVCR
jgi:sugar-specific transcriptional regulator TrmB